MKWLLVLIGSLFIPWSSVAQSLPKPQTIITERLSNAIVLPVTINAAGQNGTFFKTDVFLTNNRSVAQEVLIGFLPAGQSTVGVDTTQRFSLAANTVYSLSDFLGTGQGNLNKTGVGTVFINAVVTGGTTIDAQGSVDASARIWTPQPGTIGTTSFTLASTAVGKLTGSTVALAAGARQDAGFRTNVGIVNFDSNPHTWSVRAAFGTVQQTFSVTVPGISMQQVAVPTAVTGGYLVINFTPDAAGFNWDAYAVTADNVTGDAWLVRAIQLQ